MENKDRSFSVEELSLVDIHQFVYERYFEVKNHMDLNELIQFHTINKYLFMAHNPKELSNLGNIVANKNNSDIRKLFEEYYIVMQKLLQQSPTVKSHVNTIYHIFGHFSKILSAKEKKEFLGNLKKFQNEEKSIKEMLEILKKWISKFDNRYLLRQTYFLLFT